MLRRNSSRTCLHWWESMTVRASLVRSSRYRPPRHPQTRSSGFRSPREGDTAAENRTRSDLEIVMVRDLVVLLLAIAAALAGLDLVRRRVPLDALRKQHGVAGVAYAVLAGLYGVILAFVLVSSWQGFENVRHMIELEADAAGNLRRHSYGFAEPGGTTLRVALS